MGSLRFKLALSSCEGFRLQAHLKHLRIVEAMVKPSLVATVCSVGWAELSYVVALRETMAQLSFEDNPPTAVIVIVGCVVAQVFSSMQLTAAERLLGKPVHHSSCRSFQAYHAFVAWSVQRNVFAGVLAALFTYNVCPQAWLLLPISKRPAAAASSIPPASRRWINRPAVIPSRRYKQDFWGLAWVGTRGASNTFEKAAADKDQTQFEADCVLDLVACRQLLLKLDPIDLEQRLRNSPYNQSKMPAIKSWLREAANTFNVSLHLPAADGRAQASKQRSDVEAEVLAVMNSVKAEPGLESELGRYHPSVWGKLERQSAGRRTSIAPSRAAQKRCEFHAEHDFDGDARASPDEFEGWDLPACRSLLVTLDENDLKRRLEMSPWSAGQARPEANWLGEAAEAFDVPIGKRSRKNSKKADIIADVLTRIHYINTSAEVSLVARLALIIRRKWCEQIFDHGKTCATVVAPSREWLTTAAAFAHSTANTNTDKPARRR